MKLLMCPLAGPRSLETQSIEVNGIDVLDVRWQRGRCYSGPGWTTMIVSQNKQPTSRKKGKNKHIEVTILCIICELETLLIEQRRGCHFWPPIKCLL